MYPNPVTNQLRVNFRTVLIDKVVVNIINDLGQIVRTASGGTIAEGKIMVPMAAMPAGLYIVQILSGNKQFFCKKCEGRKLIEKFLKVFNNSV